MTLSRLARLVADLSDAAYYMLACGDIVGYDRVMNRATRIANHYKHLIPTKG